MQPFKLNRLSVLIIPLPLRNDNLPNRNYVKNCLYSAIFPLQDVFVQYIRNFYSSRSGTYVQKWTQLDVSDFQESLRRSKQHRLVLFSAVSQSQSHFKSKHFVNFLKLGDFFCFFMVNRSPFLNLNLKQQLTHVFKVEEVNLINAANSLICNSQLKLKPHN